MNKRILIFIAALLFAGLLISCSSTAWILNPYRSYSQDKYICAVGRGYSPEEADLAARKELASLFGMTVQSTVSRTLIETSAEKDGKTSESFGEYFTSTASMSVNADNLYGVEIAMRTVEKDGTYVSLAVMEKKATTDFYLARMKSQGEEIEALKASAPSYFGTMRGVKEAASLVRKTNDYNTSVVMCNYLSGSEIPFKSLADGYSLHRQACESVVLEVNVEGDDSGAVKSTVSKIFTNAGFAVSNGTLVPNARVAVTIVWRESAGTGVASSFIFADYNADVSVIDLAESETIMVYSTKGKEGHQNYESAKARAVSVLVSTLEEEFKASMSEYFTY